MAKKYYVNTAELTSDWTTWSKTASQDCWENLLTNIYAMCKGIASTFKPRDEIEHNDLAHEAFVFTVDKIKNGRLKDNGRTPFFNLLTTAIIRHLFSFKTRQTRHNRLLRTTYMTKVTSKLN